MNGQIIPFESAGLLVQQIGLALFHSVWIGAVTALLAGIVVITTRRSNAEVRYNLLTALLLLFVISAGYAFISLAPPVSQEALGPALPSMSTQVGTASKVMSEDHSQLEILSFLFAALKTHAQLVTWLWLAVVTLKMAGLLFGLYQLRRLKTSRLYPIGKHWEQRVEIFARQMDIRRSIRIFQSGLVKVPMVLGHFRPVILVPLGVITSIPADQIEMVILHELAHIRRLDFLVNFMQKLVELLFFFNPGILWVSRLIREERENCCDDIALRHAGNQVVYINALLSFRQHQLSSGVYQLAFNGKGGIVERAKRIASRTNSTLGMAEKYILALTMVALLTVTALFAHSPGTQAKTVEAASRAMKSAQTRKSAYNGRNQSQKIHKTRNAGPIAPQGPETPSHKSKPDGEMRKADFAKGDKLGPLRDTLRPLQKSQGLPVLQPLDSPTYSLKYHSDSSAKMQAPTTPLFRSETALQPMQNYQTTRQPIAYKSRSASLSEKILTEIEIQGIPITRTNVDFRITNAELIVNGLKQPEEVHLQVLKAVLKNPGDVIDFTYGSHQ